MGEQKILLETKKLKKYYQVNSALQSKKKKYLKAVDGVDLVVHQGEVVGLVGESGCGKSTLGKTVLKVHSVTEGEIIYQGEHIEDYNLAKMRPLRRDMQMIFQDPYAALNPRMTVFASAREPLTIQDMGLTEEQKEERTKAILSKVGVTEQHFEKYPHELSGGQRQRVVIARAMITNPKFVVCDEPVSALDVSVRAQVLNLMRRLQRETGVSYLFISHDLSVVKYICDTIYVMYLGKVVEKSSKKELFENPSHPYTQALISAIPIPDLYTDRERIILSGDIPSPVNPPMGCPFHTRCKYATERCMESVPELRDMGGGHCVACHRIGEF
ncbi:MAG: dipeptide ABC transporter ATP-binding protein [Lachnospiraceae bacterium]|nr:dipeptide ABC transporter ATP-binding protein [Lachnospiraceae bacterium]